MSQLLTLALGLGFSCDLAAAVPSVLNFDQDNLRQTIEAKGEKGCIGFLDDEMNFKLKVLGGSVLEITAEPVNERPANLLVECDKKQFYVTLRYENRSKFSQPEGNEEESLPRAYISSRFSKSGGLPWYKETRVVDGSWNWFQIFSTHRQRLRHPSQGRADGIDFVSQGSAWSALLGAGYSRNQGFGDETGTKKDSVERRAQAGLLGIYGSFNDERSSERVQAQRFFVYLPRPLDLSLEVFRTDELRQRTDRFEKRLDTSFEGFSTAGFLSFERKRSRVDFGPSDQSSRGAGAESSNSEVRSLSGELSLEEDLAGNWSLLQLVRSGCVSRDCYLDELGAGSRYQKQSLKADALYSPVPNALSLSASGTLIGESLFQGEIRKQFQSFPFARRLSWIRDFPDQDYLTSCSFTLRFLQPQKYSSSEGRWEFANGYPLCSRDAWIRSYLDVGYLWKKNLWSFETHVGGSDLGAQPVWAFWTQVTKHVEENILALAERYEKRVLEGVLRSNAPRQSYQSSEVILKKSGSEKIQSKLTVGEKNVFVLKDLSGPGRYVLIFQKNGQEFKKEILVKRDEKRIQVLWDVEDHKEFRIRFVEEIPNAKGSVEIRDLGIINEIPEIEAFVATSPDAIGQGNTLFVPYSDEELRSEDLRVNEELLPANYKVERKNILESGEILIFLKRTGPRS